jgi:hypothetical protein
VTDNLRGCVHSLDVLNAISCSEYLYEHVNNVNSILTYFSFNNLKISFIIPFNVHLRSLNVYIDLSAV